MKITFDSVRQNILAEKFHVLHHGPEMLVLPNAWDCASAKTYEEAGFKAIATTSSGISWSCGYQDGEHIPPSLMIEVISRITHSVNIPVTADIEAGYYGNDLENFSQFIGDVTEAGAVGINLEDADPKTKTLYDLKLQTEKIKRAKAIAKQKGVDLFVNARTDAIEHADGNIESRISACIERSHAFEEAGADGIFVPFIREIETVAEIKKGIRLPLNVLMSDTLSVAELRKLKVNRVSIGGKPMLASLHLLRKIADELYTGNDWSSLFVKSPDYRGVNGWFG